MNENFTTEEVFESAVSIVRNLPKDGPIKPSDELKLKLYSLFKQSTHGPNDTSKPRFYQIVEAYKWDAWRKLGDMSKEEAMLKYIEELRQIMKTIPAEESNVEDEKHFQDVLGKKFYDYWFKQWKQSGNKQQQLATSGDEDKRSSLLEIRLSQQQQQLNSQETSGDYYDNTNITNNNRNVCYDSKICISDEENQSCKSDGYKTPSISSFKGTCTGFETSIQFNTSVLRLQCGLQQIENSLINSTTTNQQNLFKVRFEERNNNNNLLFKSQRRRRNNNKIFKMTAPVAFDTNCMTLTRFLIEEQRKYPTATGELTTLLNALQTAVKSVSSAVRKAGMMNLFGLAETINVQGEEVKRLDVLSNELFINMLKSSYTTYTMISEENEDPIKVDEDKAGKYMIAFDPLDGSSNIEASVSIGSIFAVYKPQQATNLPTGRSIVAAGYALYGSATVIVLAINAGAHFFMLDPAIGEFILTEPNFTVKPRGNIYSVNEGYHSKWDEAMKNYVQNKKYPKEAGQKPYSSRYVGSMVADLHRTFKYGGIFMYPRTADAPNGKLRLLYECNPMAFIAEKAGGKAMAAPDLPILDVKPTKIHERTPIFIGSVEDVDEIMSEYKRLNSN